MLSIFYIGVTVFRKEFARLGKLRTLLPPDVNIMALTATATNSTRRAVVKRLSMDTPAIVYVPPIKSNVSYIVRKRKEDDLDILSKSLATSLLQNGVDTPRTIVFCRQYKECAYLYHSVKALMGLNFTKPPGMPDLHRFRLVEMFCRCTEQSLKEKIVTTFTTKDSCLRVVIATISFRMGLDCPMCGLSYTMGLQKTLKITFRKPAEVAGTEVIVVHSCYFVVETTNIHRNRC